jgi:hypothetical protein
MKISKEMMIAAAKAYHSVAFGLHPHALRAALESVLADTEPMAWLVKRYDLDGVLLDTELSFVRPTIKSTCRTDMVPLYAAPPAPSTAKALELDGVPDALAYGKGIWRTCTGCHESNEGYQTGPFSDTFKCHLGGGCFECGGVGAVWDATDYEDMGNFIAASGQVQDLARYQSRVEAAHHALFHDDPTDIEERRARFWEEAGETVQSFGMTEEDAIQLVRYTWSRAKGEPAKEIGAAMLTLASLCVVAGYNLSECAEADLEKLQRPETIARIRAKRSTRHGRGPLPGFDPAAPAKHEGGADGC